MLNLHDISIKNKLIWMQVITCILVLGLCFAVFIATNIRGYKKRKVNSTIAITQVIGTNSISAIQFLDTDAATKILTNVEPDVLNATILDKKGNIFAKYTKNGAATYNFSPPFVDGHKFSNGFLYIYNNITKQDELLGTVCIQVELSELAQIEDQDLQITMLLFIIGIAFAFLFAMINQQYISKPLLSLVTVMKKVSDNEDYNKHVDVIGKDEIAALSLEFNNLMDQIILSHQKKDEFIGIASHELKTPLTSVKGYLEILNSIELEQPAKSFVIKSLNSANKLQHLIFDLLDVTKIQAGQLQLDIKEFNIGILIDECIREAQVNTSTHTIIKENELTNQIIAADRNRIEQVIINLLSNAIKYSPKEKNIFLNAEKVNSKIIVSIKDFGVGLPKSDYEKIFERFYRSKEEKSGASGFGLGLYICAEIIKRHNGKIWVESEEDKGSTFYFELLILN